MEFPRARIDEFDILRGIGIVCMIIAHRLPGVDWLYEWIHTFHMPLFVFISGYLFKLRDGWDFLSRSVKRLLLPFVVVCFVAFYFNEPSGNFKEAMLYSNPPLWVVWFLPALFVVQVEANWLLRKGWTPLLGIVLSVVAMFGYKICPFPLYVWQGLFMFPFFVLGHFCARFQWLSLLRQTRTQTYVFGFSLIVWFVAFFIEPSMLRLAVCQSGLWFFGDVIMSVSACLALFLLCRWLMSLQFAKQIVVFLRWMGNMSMPIMCLHAIDHHLLVGFPWTGIFWNYTSFLGEYAFGIGYLLLEIPVLILLALGISHVKPLRYIFGLE